MDILAAMRVFVRVVERGNMSRAARDLGIGQPAVSDRIDRLEGHLGVKLLRRSTRVVACTDEGTLFYERSKQVIEVAEEACAAASGRDRTLRGVLRIAAPQGLGEVIMPRILMGIREEHPKLNLDLILNDHIVDLVTEGVDISLRLGRLDEGSYVAHRIGHVRRVLVASPEYLGRTSVPHGPEDLINHPYIRVMGVFGDGILRLVDAQDCLVSTPIRAAVNMSHWRPVYESLVAGAGIGVLQEPVCAQAIANGRLVRLLPQYSVPGFDLHALFTRPISLKVRTVMTVLERELATALQGFTAQSE
ncbi:HTH-type transcriptional regulator DmlR (plasmid) [Burkholderia sp. AD24]|nr:HTH-type transcriptional regulator DmlR [Burkholderia sp. AD24]